MTTNYEPTYRNISLVGYRPDDGISYVPPKKGEQDPDPAHAEHRAALSDHLRKEAAKSRKRETERLLDLAEVSPECMLHSLSQLTILEKRCIQYALSGGDAVNLPYATAMYRKTREGMTSTHHAAEVAVGRAFKRLYNRGLGTVEKRPDGLVWFNISRERLLLAIKADVASKRSGAAEDIYLIKVPSEIQTSQSEGPKRSPKTDPLAIPKNATNWRLAAIQRLMGSKVLDDQDRNEIDILFMKYMSDVDDKIIALLNDSTGEAVGMEYSTRFNDISKAAKNLKKFDYAISKSFEENRHAVFLTLTTDPNLTDEERAEARDQRLRKAETMLSRPNLTKVERTYWSKRYWQILGPDKEMEDIRKRILFGTATDTDKARLLKLEAELARAKEIDTILNKPSTGIRVREALIGELKRMNRWTYRWDPEGFGSNWEANRSFGPNWNRFMSYLKKVLGYRPKYVTAYEYTDSGLLHLHALIFVKFLIPVEKISEEWRRVGQGEIAYIYSLNAVKKRNGGGFEWRWNAKARPADAKTMSGGDYLKKYVRKAMLALMDDYTPAAHIQSLYWAFNKRFNSCSRSLMDGFDEEKEGSTVKPPSAWRLWMVVTSEEAADMDDLKMVYHKVTRESMEERRRLSSNMGVT